MSALFERMAVDCHTRTHLDGAWTDGDAFTAATVKDTSFEARIAEKQTGRASYTITSSRALTYHEVFKRDSDGQVFRITSEAIDGSPPSEASFFFYQAQAELWEEPT